MPLSNKKISIHVHNPESDAPALVLLHGWGLNQAIWIPLVPNLTPHFRVITLDLPGFGESGWRADHAHFDHTTTDIMAAVSQVTSQPFFLAGWSMGGLFATHLARQYPTYIRGLVTIASSPCFVEQAPDWPGIKEETLASFRYQLSTDFRKTLERFLAVQALGSPRAREEIKTMRALLAEKPEPHPQALAAGLRWLAEVDLRAEMPLLERPLLRLYGRLDSLVPQRAQAAVERTLTNQDDTAVTFTQSAHAPFLTETELLIETLVAWCESR